MSANVHELDQWNTPIWLLRLGVIRRWGHRRAGGAGHHVLHPWHGAVVLARGLHHRHVPAARASAGGLCLLRLSGCCHWITRCRPHHAAHRTRPTRRRGCSLGRAAHLSLSRHGPAQCQDGGRQNKRVPHVRFLLAIEANAAEDQQGSQTCARSSRPAPKRPRGAPITPATCPQGYAGTDTQNDP